MSATDSKPNGYQMPEHHSIGITLALDPKPEHHTPSDPNAYHWCGFKIETVAPAGGSVLMIATPAGFRDLASRLTALAAWMESKQAEQDAKSAWLASPPAGVPVVAELEPVLGGEA